MSEESKTETKSGIATDKRIERGDVANDGGIERGDVANESTIKKGDVATLGKAGMGSLDRRGKTVMIAPSILSGNFARIEEEVRSIEQAGADMIHLDVMDGCFVPNITFGMKMVADIRRITTLPLDAHLMIINPDKYAKEFVKAGADYVTIHAETTSNAAALLGSIREMGAKCGIAFNPDKPVDIIKDVASLCDLVLVMSVFPGFSGQRYIEGSELRVQRVREILRACENNSALVQIDGGINLENAPLVFSKGADILVTGNTFFGAENRQKIVRAIKTACSKRA